MKKNILIVWLVIVSSLFATDYEDTLKNWNTHEDVADWLKKDWYFDTQIAKKTVQKIKSEGPSSISVKSAEETFNNSRGWCKDAANFGVESLNKINSSYEAKYIFILNKIKSAPNHWVTGFKHNGKLYVMDYGAGKHWKSMMGLHGPYESLDQYADFLRSLDIENFELDFVQWRGSEELSSSEKDINPKIIRRANIVLGKFDTDRDNYISFDEAPKKMQNNFKRLDKNSDERLELKELYLLPAKN